MRDVNEERGQDMEPEHPTAHTDKHDPQFSAQEAQELRWFSALEQEFPAIYHRVRNLIIEYAHDIHPDLDAAGYVVLVQIRYRAPIRAAQLVDHLNIDKGAISRQVRLLLHLKLIDRLVDPDDTRASLLIPTQEGARRLDQLQITRQRHFQATFPLFAELFESLLTARAAKDDETGG
jgi:DNA-binding MarR family transcriptional regulator